MAVQTAQRGPFQIRKATVSPVYGLHGVMPSLSTGWM